MEIILPPKLEAELKKLLKRKPIRKISAKAWEKTVSQKRAQLEKKTMAVKRKKQLPASLFVPIPPAKQNWIIWSSVRAPYSNGQPDPELLIREMGVVSGNEYVVTEELAHNRTGYINLGVLGGNWYTEDFSYLLEGTPMTGTWAFGDGTQATGKIVQMTSAASLSYMHSLYIYVGFATNSDNSKTFGANYFENIFAIPGAYESALHGLVGIVGVFNVKVQLGSVDEAGNFTADQEASNSQTFLGTWNNRNADGSVNVIADDWNFDTSGGGVSVSSVGVEIKVGATINYLRVEASVTISGLRGGVNDPLAGEVAAIFQNYAIDHATPVPGAGHESAFEILGISMFYRTR